MSKKELHPETIVLHAGWRADPATGSVAPPIYQTTSYQFKSTEHAANLFALKELGNIYTRLGNPTTDILEQRITALEGGAASLAVASGQAASAFSIQNLAKAGDNIVSSTDLYGGTWNLFANTLRDQGIEVRFVDPTDPQAFAPFSGRKSRPQSCPGRGAARRRGGQGRDGRPGRDRLGRGARRRHYPGDRRPSSRSSRRSARRTRPDARRRLTRSNRTRGTEGVCRRRPVS